MTRLLFLATSSLLFVSVSRAESDTFDVLKKVGVSDNPYLLGTLLSDSDAISYHDSGQERSVRFGFVDQNDPFPEYGSNWLALGHVGRHHQVCALASTKTVQNREGEWETSETAAFAVSRPIDLQALYRALVPDEFQAKQYGVSVGLANPPSAYTAGAASILISPDRQVVVWASATAVEGILERWQKKEAAALPDELRDAARMLPDKAISWTIRKPQLERFLGIPGNKNSLDPDVIEHLKAVRYGASYWIVGSDAWQFQHRVRFVTPADARAVADLKTRDRLPIFGVFFFAYGYYRYPYWESTLHPPNLQTLRPPMVAPDITTVAEAADLISTNSRRLYGKAYEAAIKALIGTGQEPRLDIELPVQIDEDFQVGRKLYEANCKRCHGAFGYGDGPNADDLLTRPRDFRMGYLKYAGIGISRGYPWPRAHDIAETARVGTPGGEMPAFEDLSAKQRDAIGAYVIWLATRARILTMMMVQTELNSSQPPETDELIELAQDALQLINERASRARFSEAPTPMDFEVNDVSVASGKKLFEGRVAVCHKCHTSGLQGMHDSWGNVVIASDLKDGLFKGGDGPADLFARISFGIPGTPHPQALRPTPPHPLGLTDEDIWDLVAYLYHLSGKNPDTKPRTHRLPAAN